MTETPKKPVAPEPNADGSCPKCSTFSFEKIYGCGSGYGIGTYSLCDCGQIFDFSPDEAS